MKSLGQILSFLVLILVSVSCDKKPNIIWKHKTTGYVYSSPIVIGSNVLIGSTDGYFYALNTVNGTLAWKVRLGNQIHSTPLFHEGTVYIGSDTGDFYAIDPENGKTRWRFHTKELISFTACADNSGVYFGSRDAGFYKLGFDGTKLWEFRANYRFGGHCSFYKDLVYSASWDTNLYALNKDSGALQWKFSTGKLNYGGVAVAENEVFLTSHNFLYRLQAEDGKLLGKAGLGEVSEVLYWQNFLWTPDGGLRKWTRDLKEQGFTKATTSTSFAPVPGPGYMIVGGGPELTAITPDLKIAWRYKSKDDFWASGVVHNNTYYTGNRDTYIYALRLP